MAFKHPEFLWGFLLLLIPFAVHLLQFRKRKKILFPGVSRLFEAFQASQKPRNIRFWLLLTLRSLFFAVLVLAFAEPFYPQSSTQSNTRWIVVYDNSPSIFLANGIGQNAHQEAQNLLQSWLKTIPTDQSFALVTNGSADGWMDANQLRISLAGISENSRPRSIKEMLRKAQQWVFRAKEDGFSPKILVVSDFQSDVLEIDPTIDYLESTSFLKVGRQNLTRDEYNLSLDTVYLNKDKSGLIAQISLNSKEPIQLLTNVGLWVNGVIKAQKQIQFEENKSFEKSEFDSMVKNVEFSIEGLSLDSFRIRIQGDEFKADNELFCQFAPSTKQKIYVERTFAGYEEIQRVIQVQPERFRLVDDEQEADWVIQELTVSQIKKYLGNSSRMIFLRNDESKPNPLISPARLSPGFLELPLFEGLLTSQLDDKTPLPEVVSNSNWSSLLAKDYDAVIQTEANETVLFKNDQADRIDIIWASEWNKGLKKIRQSVWFLPLISQLIYASSSINDELYFIENGKQEIQLSSGNEIQNSGFFKVVDNGATRSVAINVLNKEFKNNLDVNLTENLKFYEDKGVQMVQTEADLWLNKSDVGYFDWSKILLYAALILILIESVVLYKMFRTKIVNSQKQA